jgi:undecaprenyl-diphosphatase
MVHPISLLIAVALAIAFVDYPLDLVIGAIDSEHFRRVRLITDVGDSALYLIPLGLALVPLYWLRRSGLAALGTMADRAFSLVLFVFTAIALSGLLVNLLKLAVGRGRPRTLEQEGWFAFQPFSFDSDFASLPSGHANTVFVLATLLVLLWPRWRLLIWSVAAWLAFTRVLIGAHFLADVIAGAALGSASTLWLHARFEALRRLPGAIISWILCQRARLLASPQGPPPDPVRA